MAVTESWLKNMFEQSQLAMKNNVERQLGPVMASLREMRVNAATKTDLEIFKAEIRQEVDARFNQEAQGIKRESSKPDPFTRKDPWGAGAWDSYKPTGASSSGSAQPDQGSTSQIPVGKWRPDGATAKTAVGGTAATFQQQQQAAAGSDDFVPSQVYIRGWSNWGDTNGITKTRATEIWTNIKKQLTVEDERLVINWTVFDPIQRIAVHVMEQPGVATHIRGRIQQIVSDMGMQQDGKELQIVIQKTPQVKRMNGQLNDKQREIREFFEKQSTDIRPVWSDHSIKGPGGAVLGRFDGRGNWKWSGGNIEKALKVEEAKVKEFLAMQSTDF